MGEPDTSHPYRPAPPVAAVVAPAPRHIPWIVRMHVLFAESSSGFAVFIVMSILAWAGLRGFSDSPDPSSGNKILFIGVSAALGVLLAIQVGRRRRSLRLLRLGRVTYATLVGKQLVPRTHDDDIQAYHLTFTFEDRGETYTFGRDTTAPGPLEDDAREQIVFMANDPYGAELVDALPGRPRVLEDNTISPADHAPGATLALMMLAGALIVEAVSAYLWLR